MVGDPGLQEAKPEALVRFFCRLSTALIPMIQPNHLSQIGSANENKDSPLHFLKLGVSTRFQRNIALTPKFSFIFHCPKKLFLFILLKKF